LADFSQYSFNRSVSQDKLTLEKLSIEMVWAVEECKVDDMVVLNIDDDPEDMEIFYKAVKTVNPLAKCLLARDAKEALHILRDAIIPDYIFLDIHMPLMDGKTVLGELRQNKKLETVPVIMYSTKINPNETEEYAALGANQFLNKHNDFRGLCTSLESLLNLQA
jgi:CheY-like chemotaxis protein